MPSSQAKKNIPYKYLSLKIYLKCIRIDGHVLILRSWKWRWSLFLFPFSRECSTRENKMWEEPMCFNPSHFCSIFSFILPFIPFIVTLELGIITIPITAPPLGEELNREERKTQKDEIPNSKSPAENSRSVTSSILQHLKPCL